MSEFVCKCPPDLCRSGGQAPDCNALLSRYFDGEGPDPDEEGQ